MAKQTVYHPNQEFTCPQCGNLSVVRVEDIVEGLFDVVGKRYVCSTCGWQIPDEQIILSSERITDSTRKSSDDAVLAALFGDNADIDRDIALDGDTTRFCKHCKHYLQSPFSCRCLLHNREVEPLGVCEQFSTSSDEKL